jgi:hypothetical protein
MVKVVSIDSKTAQSSQADAKVSITGITDKIREGARSAYSQAKVAANGAAQSIKPAVHHTLANLTGTVPGNMIREDGSFSFFAGCVKK